MSKKIVGVDGECLTSIKLVKGVVPCNSQVLVEILTPQELMNTNLTISEKTDLSNCSTIILGVKKMPSFCLVAFGICFVSSIEVEEN